LLSTFESIGLDLRATSKEEEEEEEEEEEATRLIFRLIVVDCTRFAADSACCDRDCICE